MVRTIIRAEGFVFFLLALLVYLQLGGNLLWFLVLFLLPDISMIGYRFDKKTGALLYNLVHNYVTGVLIFAVGLLLGQDVIGFAGLILLSHVGIDRALGFGLKYPSSFKDTHMQRL